MIYWLVVLMLFKLSLYLLATYFSLRSFNLSRAHLISFGHSIHLSWSTLVIILIDLPP